MVAGLEEGHERPPAGGERASLVVDDMEVPLDTQAFQPERAKPTRRDLPADGISRDECHAQPAHDGLLDGLDVVELHGGPEPHPRLSERSLSHQTGG